MKSTGKAGLLAACARIGIVLAVVTQSGCGSTIPLHGGQATREKLSAALGLSPDEIRGYSRCLIGQARGEAAVPRFECVYVQAPEWAAVLDYDPKTQAFSRAFTFDRTIRGIAFQEQATLLGPMRQLQVQMSDRVLILDFVNAELGTIGMSGKLTAAYEQLKGLGVPEMTPLPFVPRPAQPQTVYIPIYVPR